MNGLHPKSARHRTMSRFSSSKGHGLTMSFVHSCHHRSLVASSLYEQIENLALIEDVWTGMTLAPYYSVAEETTPGRADFVVERRGFEPMAIAVSRPRIAGFRQRLSKEMRGRPDCGRRRSALTLQRP